MQRLSRELHRALASRVRVRAVAWAGSQKALPLFGTLAALRGISWLLKRDDRLDVILAGDVSMAPLCLALGRITGRPVATIAHGLDVSFRNTAYQAAIAPALRAVDLVLAISESTRSIVIAHGGRPGRCVTVGCALDADSVPPRAAARRQLLTRVGLPGDAPHDLLVTTGRLVRRKGVAWMLDEVMPRVLAARPDSRYVIAGDGTDRAAVAAAAARLGDAAVLLGRIDDAARADLLAAADLFVMPNVLIPGDPEGFGLVAVEAAYAGLPTVATRVDSIAEAVIDGETGLLVPGGDSAALADALIRLLEDRHQLAALGQTAKQAARQRFAWSFVVDRYVRALAGLVEAA